MEIKKQLEDIKDVVIELHQGFEETAEVLGNLEVPPTDYNMARLEAILKVTYGYLKALEAKAETLIIQCDYILAHADKGGENERGK